MSAAVEVLKAARAAGVNLTVEGDKLAAQPRSNLTDELRATIRFHKPELLSRLRGLRQSFNLVMRAFRTRDDEIELAWSIAVANLDAAEVTFHTSAAIIRAGWRPLEEQAAAFLARHGVTR